MCYDLCKTSIFTNFKFHHVYTYLRSTFTNAKFNKSLENQIYRSLLTVILRFYDSYSEYHKKKNCIPNLPGKNFRSSISSNIIMVLKI